LWYSNSQITTIDSLETTYAIGIYDSYVYNNVNSKIWVIESTQLDTLSSLVASLQIRDFYVLNEYPILILEQPTFTSIDEQIESLPTSQLLVSNYPNPFNPTTTIKIKLRQSDIVNITVFNSNGHSVQDIALGRITAGTHNYSLNLSQYPSGIYFVRINTSRLSETLKITLLK